ncbi:hypothetical protein H8F25_13750 [Synechococcus sp. CBW1004]|nr:hypothetical protein H8F25_13750 [Synechococcus sp. CBW1004]
MASVISEVLNQRPPTRDANFFQLGGDSLFGTKVMTRLSAQLGLDLPPTLLFIAPTVRTLSEQLETLIDQALAQFEVGR